MKLTNWKRWLPSIWGANVSNYRFEELAKDLRREAIAVEVKG